MVATANLPTPLPVGSQSVAVVDLASVAITATGNGAAIPLDGGNTYAAVVNVSAVSGTGSPKLDLFLQETFDGGATFTDIYQVYRITATGTYLIPTMLLTGQRRFRWAVSGTNPSFTTSIMGVRGTGTANVIRNFYDYTALSGADTTHPTPTYNVAGCKTLEISVFNGTSSGTQAVFQAQLSPEGTNFTNVGGTVNPAQFGLGMVNIAHQCQFARVGCVTANVGGSQVINYANIYGIG